MITRKLLAMSSPPFSLKPPSALATNVIISYFETGLIKEARMLFDEMPERDVIAWSAMISGYTSCNHPNSSWSTFLDMRRDDAQVQPNEFTLSSVLKACKSMNSLSCGTLVHSLAVKQGLIGNIYVGNALMDMYGSCCDTTDRACTIFEEIVVKNSVSWTTLLASFTHLGDGYGAIQLFQRMLLEEAELNPFTISIAIRACASTGSKVQGQQIHAIVFKHAFDSSIPVMNSILDMYCRCTGLSNAVLCFRGMKERDIISCNTLIAGYEKSDPDKALDLFSRLEFDGLTPNCFTFTSVIAAVANMAVLALGQQVHGGAVKRGIEDDIGVANALIDMYAKCGSILSSSHVFHEMHSKNVVSWTSMIIGYGSHGDGKEAINLFENMVQSGVKPDRIAFVAVLNACSHTGLVDEGLKYFKSMVDTCRIQPDQEIYGCVVDLLGRAGRLKEAYMLIEAMPFTADESVWGAFLGACKAHKLADMGMLAARKVLDFKPGISGTYMALSNIYAADGKWGDSARIRKFLRGIGNKKDAGKSWIVVKDRIFGFVATDKLGPQVEAVYEAIDLLHLHIKESRQRDDFQVLIHNYDDET